jgi:hypothetical protein
MDVGWITAVSGCLALNKTNLRRRKKMKLITGMVSLFTPLMAMAQSWGAVGISLTHINWPFTLFGAAMFLFGIATVNSHITDKVKKGGART